MALSSSSYSSRNLVYDVFPSFRGKDVHVTFVTRFLKALDRRLITAFKDKKIERNLTIELELVQAIRDSRIAVVVFSKNYASSSCCLNELLEIVKCKEEFGQIVIPVFYHLDPSDVRKQTGEFGNIFMKTCENRSKEVKSRWQKALIDVSNIVGYHSRNWFNNADMVEKIANDILNRLLTRSMDYEVLVGIEDHLSMMNFLLHLKSAEVRMVGICGPPGIGKTTIARSLFGLLSPQFKMSIFIDRAFVSKSMENYTGAEPEDYMKLHLQELFFSEILGKKDIQLSHLGGVREKLKHHKVLIFVDDLDDQLVLDALVGQAHWFGCGSRIVVISRDKYFLTARGIDYIYEVGLPSKDLCLEMLCRSAFRKNYPPDGLMELASEVVLCAGDLPLGLNVLGSYLRGIEEEGWRDTLLRLRNVLDGKIEKTLRVSYDGLNNEKDKAVFVHIACLFQGEKVNDIKLLLADSDFDINITLKNLVDKSLVHVREGAIEMHPLLEEMGKEIVRTQSNEPGERKFLVDSKDACDVLEYNTGTKKILGMALDIDKIDDMTIHENAFEGMLNLHFLKLYTEKWDPKREFRWNLREGFEYFPPKLRLLRWDGYPVRSLPSNFRPENLIKLQMRGSKLEKLWEGVHPLKVLRLMDLRGSRNLKEIPDLSMATNLEELLLSNCSRLVELPSSIGNLHKLEKLIMQSCKNLEILPTGINLQSLYRLDLRGCSRLKSFPDISTSISNVNLMKNMSVKLLKGVQPLTPSVIMLSPSLTSLWLSDIPSLVELPSSFHNLSKLKELSIISCINLETLPNGINLESLDVLDLSGCSQLKSFPNISTNISELYLDRTAIEEVPWWIEIFSPLSTLHMSGCNNLKYVSLNISKLKHLERVDFSDCRALTEARWNDSPIVVAMATDNIHSTLPVPNETSSPLPDNYVSKVKLNLINCFNLDQEALYQQESTLFNSMELSGEEVPSYFTHRSTGTTLTSIPLLYTSTSQQFFKFKACVVVDSESSSIKYLSFNIKVCCRFIDKLGNYSESAEWELYFSKTRLGSHLVIFTCCFLNEDNSPLAELNYYQVDIEFHLTSDYSQLKLRGCGIRILDGVSNVSEGDKSNKVNFGGHETENSEEFRDSSLEMSSSRNWVYDVFLSFSGEDVRKNFLSHFLKELDRKFIKAFKDNEIKRSHSVNHHLVHAIRDSRIAVVVFSNKYASSSWCLSELLEIMKCKKEFGQKVIPIFYRLDPSNVRKQTGNFGMFFQKTCENKTEEETQLLRQALNDVANTLGHDSVAWGKDAKIIKEIAYDILSKLNVTPSKEQIEVLDDYDACYSRPEELEGVVGDDGSLRDAKPAVNVKKAESVQGAAKFHSKPRRVDNFIGEVNSGATSNLQSSIEKKSDPVKEEARQGKVSESSTMVNYERRTPKHHVFINSWGEEVRFSFISHLVSSFSREVVSVFIGTYEKRDEDLGKKFQSIENSSIALVIFSNMYTESRWCIEELVRIKERMDEGKMLVIPIFYKVEPSQVKELGGDFGLKFWNLWRVHRDHRIIKWKDALESVASMMGSSLEQHSSESKFITFIVDHVLRRISSQEVGNLSFLPSTGRKKTPKFSTGKTDKHEVFLTKCPIFGLEQHMNQVEQKLEFDCTETRIIGVVGMAGIGKTTLAMSLYEKWNCKFVRCVPLLNISEESRDYRPAWLRKTLLEVLLGGKFPVINDKTTHESLKDKLLQTKVFVVLDDVSNKKQLKYLLGNFNWLKKGSKIVITSRDKSLIEGFVHDTYEIPPLKYGEALQLFSYHAFGDPVFLPTVTSMKLCREVVDCAGGNPQVVKLLGKQFHGRNEAQWEMRQEDLTHLGMLILDIFRFSYDELSEKQKDVFLDIACFFRSEDEYFARSLLDSGYHEVRDLTHKGMIAISGCRVEMHDLLYIFGKIFSSQAFIEHNEGKSRLWYTQEIIDALINQKDTKRIRGIFLDRSKVTKGIVLHRPTFINMINLRYLKIYDSCCPRACDAICNLHFPDGLEFPSEVRYLHWVKFPLEELPLAFRPDNLVDLSLPYSRIERVWEDVKDTPRLKWVDLSYSSKLLNLSGFSKAGSLQRLNLEGCTNLDEFPREIQNMKSLVYLNMRGCIRLMSLPKINLMSLKTLILSDCSNLKEFQVISKSLEALHLDGTAIKGLPLAIENLQRLVLFNLKNCKMLECLPNCLGQLKFLEELILSGCSKLKNLSDVRHSMKHVQILLLDMTGAKEMPKISCFTGSKGKGSVDVLSQDYGSYLSRWPHGFDEISSLRRLCLSGNDFVSLENDIGQLYNLKWLDVKQCKKLRSVPMLPPRLQYFDAHGCDSLEKVANPLALLVPTEQAHAIFIFSNCNKLGQDATDSITSYTRRRSQLMLSALSGYNEVFDMGSLVGTCFPGWEVPEWFSHRGSGSVLESELPDSWCEKRFIGIALCAVIFFPSNHEQTNRLLVNCNCEVKDEDGSSIHFSCTVGGSNELSNASPEKDSSHIFIGYTSWFGIRKRGGCDNKAASFCKKFSLQFQVTDGTEKVVGCEVRQCGFSLVYATNEREKPLVEGLAHDSYVVPHLNNREAFQVFNHRAFDDKICIPRTTFLLLSKMFVDNAGGDILALKLLGSELRGKDEAYWVHKLQKVTQNSYAKIQDVWKFCIVQLSVLQKEVLLDIACFFRSEDEYFVKSLLDSGDPDSTDAVSEVRDLAEKLLITISNGRVEMNDQLSTFSKGLGSPGGFRLWKARDILDKLRKMKTLEASNVRGIFLDMREVMQSISMGYMTFVNMRNLRYLKIYDSCSQKSKSDCKLKFPDGFSFPLEEVRYLHWMKFPLEEVPPDFRPKNLVDLRLPYSNVERLWKDVKDTPRLKWVDLSHSSKLLNLSGLSKSKSLQRLNLEGCTNLAEFPREMENMKSLVYLNMRGCIRLRSLPKIVLMSLKTLILSDCSNLKEFQVISQSLEELHLDGTAIKGLPLAIENLQRLVLLNLKNCKMLECLPNCLGQLKFLEKLILSGCSRLKNLPDIRYRHSMKHVDILLYDTTGAKKMPKISYFTVLKGKAFGYMFSQHPGSYPSGWPRGFDEISSLRRLCLSGNDFVSLENDIGKLYNLKWLDVKHCKKLRSVPMLPPRLQYFDAHGCDSLERVANPLAIQMLTEQIHATFNFSNCNKLDQDATEAIISYTRWKSQLILDALSRYNEGFTLEASIRTCYPGWEIPAWFSHRGSGSLLESKLPPHWCDNRLTGIALCAVILFSGCQNQQNHHSVKCNFEFKNEDGSCYLYSFPVGGWSEPGKTTESSHVFIGYASKLDIKKLSKGDMEGCVHTEASCAVRVTDGTKELEGCEVLKCGFSLVYASDESQVQDFGEHTTTVEANEDITFSSWVQDFFGYIFLVFSCVIVFTILSFSLIVFAPRYYLSFSDFCWPLLARIFFFLAFGLFLKQKATTEN